MWVVIYKLIHNYNEHGSHENSFHISNNMHRIYFILNQSFINILHGHKLVRLPLTRTLKIN